VNIERKNPATTTTTPNVSQSPPSQETHGFTATSHAPLRHRDPSIAFGLRSSNVSADLSRRVRKVVAYPPLCEMNAEQRREFHEALLDADSFEDLPGKWQGAISKAEENRPNLQTVDSPRSTQQP
jgi:hypothetical protein